ncbi:MAG: Ig-like domain-containing protein [Candidatus Omnitrophota bacterium]|nr:Ig-like domain-containing protein [Candidatus Omnitrophota bacterium]
MIWPKLTLVMLLAAFFSLGMGPRPKPQPADTTPPQISISAPANNSTVSGSVNIQAQATDNIGVAKVEFYVDNSLQSADTTSPYAYSWDTTTATNASHALKAIAYDAKNNSKQAQINVTVNNAVLPADPELGISSISASGSNASHPASAAADKNTSTYWQGN